MVSVLGGFTMCKVYGINPDGSAALIAIPDANTSAAFIDADNWALDISGFDFKEYAVFCDTTAINPQIGITVFTDTAKVTLNGPNSGGAVVTSGPNFNPFANTGAGDYYASRGIPNPNGWTTGSYPGKNTAAQAGPAVLHGTQAFNYFTENTYRPVNAFNAFTLSGFVDSDPDTFVYVFVEGLPNQGVLATYGPYSGANTPFTINAAGFTGAQDIRVSYYYGTNPDGTSSATGNRTNTLFIDWDSLRLSSESALTIAPPPPPDPVFVNANVQNPNNWTNSTLTIPGLPIPNLARTPNLTDGSSSAITFNRGDNVGFNSFDVYLWALMGTGETLSIECYDNTGTLVYTNPPIIGERRGLVHVETGTLVTAVVFIYYRNSTQGASDHAIFIDLIDFASSVI